MAIPNHFSSLILVTVLVAKSDQQSYTFPLSPGQNPMYAGPQYNNVYNSRFPYAQNQNPQMLQMSSQQHPQHSQHYAFNPVARINVQPDPSPSMFQQHQSRLSFPTSPNEYQVDQKIPLPTDYQKFEVPRPPPMPQLTNSATEAQNPNPNQNQNQPMRLIPSFLKTASSGDQDKFYEIVQHPTWNAVEKNRKIEEFMKTMNEERQNMYTTYREEVHKEMEDRRKNVDQAVSSMSKGAFEEFQKVVSIMRDPLEPENVKLKKIEEIYAKLPDEIRKEFDSKLKGF